MVERIGDPNTLRILTCVATLFLENRPWVGPSRFGPRGQHSGGP
jgi:hypothetical protein